MAAANLTLDTALTTILEHSVYTLTRLEAFPLTEALAAPYVAFQKAWATTSALELEHTVAILRAMALVMVADDDLDLLVDRASNVLLSLTGNDRSAPLYKQYFGDKRPSEFRRPVLGAQLDAMRTWLPSLKASPHPALVTLGNELEPKILTAEKAKDSLAAAHQANRVFRATGERRALIDHFNAIRKDTYGKLAALPHTHPELNLTGSFPERFFKRVSAPKPADTPLSSEELLAQISEAEGALRSLRDQLTEASAREEEEATAKAKKSTKEADLKALKAKRKELDAEIAAKESVE